MTEVGFTLGDVISIYIGQRDIEMPYYGATSFSSYLLSHGMSSRQLGALILALQ